MQINNKNNVLMEAQKYDSRNNKIFLVCKKQFNFTQKITTTFLHLATRQFFTKARQQKGGEKRKEGADIKRNGRRHKM